MCFESFQLVKRVCHEVTLPAVRAADHGNVLDHQQARAMPVAAGYPANLRTGFAADIASESLLSIHGHSR